MGNHDFESISKFIFSEFYVTFSGRVERKVNKSTTDQFDFSLKYIESFRFDSPNTWDYKI